MNINQALGGNILHAELEKSWWFGSKMSGCVMAWERRFFAM